MSKSYIEEAEIDCLRRENAEMRNCIEKLNTELAQIQSDNKDLKDLVIRLNMRYLMGY